MITLQRRLRQLRSWQCKTLLSVAKAIPYPLKTLVELETEGKCPYAKEQAACSYGLTVDALDFLLEEEYDWRVSGRTGNLATLPRLARYLYRGDLPQSARALFQDGFVIVDAETTGKDAHDPAIELVQITILDTDGVPVLNSLVKPERAIPEAASAIHHIADADVADAPTFRDLYPAIYQALHGQTVVVYNADFDCYLLDNLIIRHGLDMPDFDQWCLMKAYANYKKTPGRYGNFMWHKLSDACEQQGVALEDAHSALGDTLATYALLQALTNQS